VAPNHMTAQKNLVLIYTILTLCMSFIVFGPAVYRCEILVRVQKPDPAKNLDPGPAFISRTRIKLYEGGSPRKRNEYNEYKILELLG
jgi:hypothetical protein